MKLKLYMYLAALAVILPGGVVAAQNGLRDAFTSKRCTYPPARLTLLFTKDEKTLEIWSEDTAGKPCLIKEYPVLAASGCIGPKLKRGDCQVPEGIYKVSWLNPNSRFYLSMKLDYPNAFDREMARLDGRLDPGGDIFIHGKAVSKGCLAMGDEAIEELYGLVSDTGLTNVRVIIAPYDFRNRAGLPPGLPPSPPWLMRLYRDIKAEIAKYARDDRKPGFSIIRAEAASHPKSPNSY